MSIWAFEVMELLSSLSTSFMDAALFSYGISLYQASSVAASCFKTILCYLFLVFQLSQLIVNAGGVAAVIDCIGSCKGNIRLPGIMMLGYVAAHSENLAMAVIISKVGAGFSSLRHCGSLS